MCFHCKFSFSGSSDDKWTKEKVRSIIINPFYAGYMSWGKRTGPEKGTFGDRETWIIIHSEYIEPIISKEDWELCWKLYCERRERKVPPKQY
ncbi:recombinase family protein, partial [Klebsiella pneumoniae]|nr:recombinase family protein [Klebsiella pneumoniae]